MTKVLKNKVQYMATIPVGLLNVDYSYQKPLSMAHVKKIVEKFDETSVGQIHVSKREDGNYFIFDGQHRWTVHKTLNIGVIECIVYEGMTIEEEAKAYNAYNTIKSQNALDRERALLVAGDEKAVQRKLICDSLGLEIDYERRNTTYAIKSIGEITKIHERYGQSRLYEVLNIVKEAYGDRGKYFQASVIRAINLLLTEYKEVIDVKWLTRRLKEFGFDQLLLDEQKFRGIYKGSKAETTKRAMIEYYNHRKRNGKLQ